MYTTIGPTSSISISIIIHNLNNIISTWHDIIIINYPNAQITLRIRDACAPIGI